MRIRPEDMTTKFSREQLRDMNEFLEVNGLELDRHLIAYEDEGWLGLYQVGMDCTFDFSIPGNGTYTYAADHPDTGLVGNDESLVSVPIPHAFKETINDIANLTH